MNQIIGAWRLVSVDTRLEDGTIIYPLGHDVSGQLMYSASGHMSGILMRRDRPMFDARQARTRPDVVNDADIRAALEGYVAYCGTWEIDEDRETVTHHVTESLIPAEVGQDNVRRFSLDGDRLRLETVGDPLHGVLVWERARAEDLRDRNVMVRSTT